MAKDKIELKAQNENLQTKIQENQEKCEENLKILCKAKKNTDNVEQQVISLKRVLGVRDNYSLLRKIPSQ